MLMWFPRRKINKMEMSRELGTVKLYVIKKKYIVQIILETIRRYS